MSTFATDVRIITELKPHTNADKLELCKVNDLAYQMVVQKDRYVIGDRVVYFPLDAVLPDTVLEAIGLSGKLSGSGRNRVKAVKLRGEISQGLIAGLYEMLACFPVGADLSAALGVTKHSPAEVVGTEGCRMISLPPGISVYDIENMERHQRALNMLMESPCGYVATEKLEGTNFCAVLDEANMLHVCSRRHAVEDGDNLYWNVARKYGMYDLLASAKQHLGCRHISVHGEVVGPKVQGNYYGLAENELYLFDIKVDYEWQNWTNYNLIGRSYLPDVPRAPFIASNTAFFEQENLGTSALNPDKLIEGVVVRPAEEMHDDRIGRVILKKKNPAYLIGGVE